MLFKSSSKNLVIADDKKRVQFRGGLYETSDANEIKLIKSLSENLPEVQIIEIKANGSK